MDTCDIIGLIPLHGDICGLVPLEIYSLSFGDMVSCTVLDPVIRGKKFLLSCRPCTLDSCGISRYSAPAQTGSKNVGNKTTKELSHKKYFISILMTHLRAGLTE